MLISSLKTLPCLLFLVLFSIICKAENDNAPAKFYDGLPIETKKAAQHPTVKAKENLAKPLLQTFSETKTASKIENETTIIDVSKRKPQELERVNTTHHPRNSPQKNLPDSSTLNSVAEDNEFVTYIVAKNETLFSIALRFKVAPAQLAAWNAVASPTQLYSGKKLKIFKNKQKHSTLKSLKKQSELNEILRDTSQKTSIISINNKNMLKFYCHWPTKGKIIKNFSQTGSRGIEINGKAGQAIKAVAEGKVAAVSPGIYGHGSFIVIEHADKVLSTYANNSRALVKSGQAVAQGQMIAEMGRVGRKPPSLEFEIRKNGVLVNPMLCLPKKT